MADNNFKGGPGGRLKAEEKKNTIYVNNPNDPRLQMYRDSLGLYNHTNDYRNILLKNSISPIKNEIIIKNLDVLDKISQSIPYSKINNNKINPIGYYDIGVGNDKQYNESAIYAKPKREVILVPPRKKSKPIEPIQPRQAPVPQLARPQMIAPVMRPVSIPQTTPMEEPMMEEQVVTERPVARKMPRAVMPTRQGGWGNQPLLMKLFPKLYER
jgi:hypothetical protein